MKKKLKTSIKWWISFKKKHRVIKFNQEASLKPYIDINKELKKKCKKWFSESLFQATNAQRSFWKKNYTALETVTFLMLLEVLCFLLYF